jgi:hypothetical protein
MTQANTTISKKMEIKIDTILVNFFAKVDKK